METPQSTENQLTEAPPCAVDWGHDWDGGDEGAFDASFSHLVLTATCTICGLRQIADHDQTTGQTSFVYEGGSR